VEKQIHPSSPRRRSKNEQEFMARKLLQNPTHEEIACCACLIYESRGREPGGDLEDWLEAEAQLITDRLSEAGRTNGKTRNERRAPWENVQLAEITTTSPSKL
jgi:Protein of unknown function (DUF2934)